jgi:RNA polymerase sigma-70 factor (ECF subfamily)
MPTADVPEGQEALHAPAGFLNWVAELVHTHRARLLGYSRRRGLNAEDALDVVQDTFVTFLKLPQARDIAYVEEDSIKLLTVLLRHTLLNHKRKLKRRAQHQPAFIPEAELESAASSESLIAQAEELARVRWCILRMARLQRQVVTLSLLDEQPRDQVASLLGITEGYARVLLFRAREHIRNCSYEYEDEPSSEDPS